MTSSISIFPQTPAGVIARSEAPAADQSQNTGPTFALYTLGCKVNQYDSHQIARMLLQRGFRRVEFREAADLYVIDTCTVTNEADRKSRKAAARARRNNPDAVVAVTGCAATYARDQFLYAVPDALVLDNTQKFELPEKALNALRARPDWNLRYSELRERDAIEPIPEATRERAVIKIQDGCNHRCSYCIIPKVRGASVQKSRATVMDEARAFVREGAREITITGVSMGDWGRGHETGSTSVTGASRGRNAELCSLLRAVTTIEGLERVRVSSLDPADVDEEFLQTVANTPKISPHIHLALQGGSAATLRRMRRRYTPELFLKWAKRWREIRPDGGLTTDIIVGFPGETAEDFEASLQVAREAKFSAIHVFPYSVRDNTVAADLPDPVHPIEQKRRVDQLLKLARELSAEYASQFIGRTVPVLIESSSDDAYEGMIPQYLKVHIKRDKQPANHASGDIVLAQIGSWNDGALQGRLII